MAPSTIPKKTMSQQKMFYSPGWTCDVERSFISFLLGERAYGVWIVGQRNDTAIKNAANYLNNSFPMKFDLKTVRDQCRKLKSRYTTFKWLIQRPCVIYDPLSHKVVAPEGAWECLYPEQMLVGPYVREGEYAFDALRELFEEEVPTRNATNGQNVIQISSDTEGVSANDSSVQEIPNPYENSLSSINEDDESSLDTDNIFWPDYAFINEDSVSWRTLCGNDRSSAQSTNSPLTQSRGKEKRSVPGPSRHGGPSGKSSCASWSPLKKP